MYAIRSYYDNNAVMHINYNNYDNHRHMVSIIENTPLYNWYNMSEINTNTYHHQGIMELGAELLPMAYAPDGLIEAVYNPNCKFLVGLQFHPERMLPDYDGNIKVFESFRNNFV